LIAGPARVRGSFHLSGGEVFNGTDTGKQAAS